MTVGRVSRKRLLLEVVVIKKERLGSPEPRAAFGVFANGVYCGAGKYSGVRGATKIPLTGVRNEVISTSGW